MNNLQVASELIRIARSLVAFEMTESEWKRYKKQHPHADRRNHHIIPDKKRQQVPFGFFKKRNHSFQRKFNGTLTEQGKRFDHQLRKSRVPLEIIDELHWNHTESMQKLCGNAPKVELTSNISGVGTRSGERNIFLHFDPNDWFGCRPTCTHEYGHYVANSIFDIEKSHDWNEFEGAVVSEIERFYKRGIDPRYKGLCEDHKKQKALKNQLSKELFGIEDYQELPFEQQWKIIAKNDILGSITGGEYGFGHEDWYYLEDFYREAFANIYLMYKYGWKEFREEFPYLWNYMENLLKGNNNYA